MYCLLKVIFKMKCFAIIIFPSEFEKQRLGCIKPLDELLSAAHMTDDEWHTLVDTRFGISVSVYMCS